MSLPQELVNSILAILPLENIAMLCGGAIPITEADAPYNAELKKLGYKRPVPLAAGLLMLEKHSGVGILSSIINTGVYEHFIAYIEKEDTTSGELFSANSVDSTYVVGSQRTLKHLIAGIDNAKVFAGRRDAWFVTEPQLLERLLKRLSKEGNLVRYREEVDISHVSNELLIPILPIIIRYGIPLSDEQEDELFGEILLVDPVATSNRDATGMLSQTSVLASVTRVLPRLTILVREDERYFANFAYATVVANQPEVLVDYLDTHPSANTEVVYSFLEHVAWADKYREVLTNSGYDV